MSNTLISCTCKNRLGCCLLLFTLIPKYLKRFNWSKTRLNKRNLKTTQWNPPSFRLFSLASMISRSFFTIRRMSEAWKWETCSVSVFFVRVSSQICRCIKARGNRSKQHFAVGLVNSVLNLPEVKFFGKSKLQKNCNQCCLWKTFLGYSKRLLGYYILAATCLNGKP